MSNLRKALTVTASHVALMGDPGSGKSTLAGKLATEGFKLIWFSTDNGHKVLEKLPDAALDNIELVRLPDTRAWPVAWTTLNKFFDCNTLMHICERHGSHECSVCKKEPTAGWTDVDSRNIPLDTIVVIDHGSQLADSCMNTVTKSQPVDYKPQLDDWGSLRFHLAALGKKMQAAPFHLLVLFQPEESKMEDGRSKLTPGWGSNNSSKTASQYFDHLVYCEVFNKSHKAGSSSTYSINAVAKSRTDIAIEKLDIPTLAPFFSMKGQIAAVDADKKAAEKVLAPVTAPAKLPETVAAKPDDSIAVAAQSQAPATTAVTATTPVLATPAAAVATDTKALLAKLKGLKK